MRLSRPMPQRQFADIAADLLAKIGHLVDEGDLGGEKRVGGVFDQLRCPALRDDDGRLLCLKRDAIKRSQDLPGELVLDTDDDSVGLRKSSDGDAFAQEFGV